MENKKKKILFVITEFTHGGSNKTLENFLPLIDKKRFDVSIFCHTSSRREGYYFDLFRPYLIRRNWLGCLLRERKGFRGITNHLFAKFPALERLYNRYEARKLQKRYRFDTVVGFQEHSTTEYVSCYPVRTRISWIHGFVKEFTFPQQKTHFANIYERSQHIVCVSDAMKDYFIQCFPSLKDKVMRIYNPLNTELIERKALEASDAAYDTSCFTLLSIGRMSTVKNFHLIPKMVSEIKQLLGETPFRWYIIGAHSSEQYCQEIVSKIHEYHVENELVLLGQKDNPYAYLRRADLLVCPSKSEGWPTVVNEAKVLHIPVVVNNFTVAHEVVPERCGYVTTLDEIASILASLIKDEGSCYEHIKSAIQSFRYENEEIARQMNELL